MTIKLILQAIGLTTLVLIGVIVFNTINVGSKQDARVPSPLEVTVDADAAAQRLAKAVRYRTISNETDTAIDEAAFRTLHEFVEGNYPRVHESLTLRPVRPVHPGVVGGCEIVGAQAIFGLKFPFRR